MWDVGDERMSVSMLKLFYSHRGDSGPGSYPCGRRYCKMRIFLIAFTYRLIIHNQITTILKNNYMPTIK